MAPIEELLTLTGHTGDPAAKCAVLAIVNCTGSERRPLAVTGPEVYVSTDAYPLGDGGPAIRYHQRPSARGATPYDVFALTLAEWQDTLARAGGRRRVLLLVEHAWSGCASRANASGSFSRVHVVPLPDLAAGCRGFQPLCAIETVAGRLPAWFNCKMRYEIRSAIWRKYAAEMHDVGSAPVDLRAKLVHPYRRSSTDVARDLWHLEELWSRDVTNQTIQRQLWKCGLKPLLAAAHQRRIYWQNPLETAFAHYYYLIDYSGV